MAQNRLFIYDPETKTACCIAKGYASGWGSTKDHVTEFFDNAQEFTGEVKSTRYVLKTEQDMPDNTKIFWEGKVK